VLTAQHGAEALFLYRQQPEEIKVVVTDMMMPVMDGAQTIQGLLDINPRLKIIAASGLESRGLKVHAFLPKPYTTEQLLTAMQSALADE
jgi:CheY-like chemotaxis protein